LESDDAIGLPTSKNGIKRGAPLITDPVIAPQRLIKDIADRQALGNIAQSHGAVRGPVVHILVRSRAADGTRVYARRIGSEIDSARIMFQIVGSDYLKASGFESDYLDIMGIDPSLPSQVLQLPLPITAGQSQASGKRNTGS